MNSDKIMKILEQQLPETVKDSYIVGVVSEVSREMFQSEEEFKSVLESLMRDRESADFCFSTMVH